MKNYYMIFTLFAALSIYPLNAMQMQTLEIPIDIPPEEVIYLDLSFVHGGDYVHGKRFSEEELAQKILSHPNVEQLHLGGQFLTPDLMSIIHDNLPQLKRLTITGSVRYINGDGEFYSWEALNPQEVSAEMLQALYVNGSPIETLDLSLTNINDEGLKQIAEGAFNLTELYLNGATHITDAGILALVDKLPHLKTIYLGHVILRQPYATIEILAPPLSPELITQLRGQGINVYQ